MLRSLQQTRQQEVSKRQATKRQAAAMPPGTSKVTGSMAMDNMLLAVVVSFVLFIFSTELLDELVRGTDSPEDFTE